MGIKDALEYVRLIDGRSPVLWGTLREVLGELAKPEPCPLGDTFDTSEHAFPDTAPALPVQVGDIVRRCYGGTEEYRVLFRDGDLLALRRVPDGNLFIGAADGYFIGSRPPLRGGDYLRWSDGTFGTVTPRIRDETQAMHRRGEIVRLRCAEEHNA